MNRKILLVDDDEDIRGILGMQLKSRGYDVCEAHNGEQALEKISGYQPDAVILDVMMPIMDGLQTCEKIRGQREFSEIPVIFVTARDDDWDLLAGYSKGCVGYIVKPVDIEELIETLEKFISSSD